MPTQNLSDKKLTAIITAGMNNTPSSEALMKYSKNYRKDDENRIYRQLPDNSSDIHLSAASSFSGGMSPSGGATPVYRSSSISNMKSEHIKSSPNHITKAQWCAVAILTFINLINYMDRYTIAGKNFKHLKVFSCSAILIYYIHRTLPNKFFFVFQAS